MGRRHDAIAVEPDCNSRLPEGWTRRLSGVSLCIVGVKQRVLVSRKRQERIRSAAAWICMLAVALLYAPMAGAALLAYGVDCCVGGFVTSPSIITTNRSRFPRKTWLLWIAGTT